MFFNVDTKLGVCKMPPAIEYSVRKQNIKFMHNRNQFNTEYFQFIRKLVLCNPYASRSNEKMVILLLRHIIFTNVYHVFCIFCIYFYYCRALKQKNYQCYLCNWHLNFYFILVFILRKPYVGLQQIGMIFYVIIY
jgi:hypothetical protein